MASSVMSATLLLIVSLVALLCLSNDVEARPKNNVVHRIPMTRRPSTHGMWPKPIADRIKQSRGLMRAATGSLPVTMIDHERVVQLSVGTPGQQIPVLVYLENLDELWVLGSDATYDSPEVKVVFNELASSTFKNESANYVGGWGLVKGYLASDVVNLGSLQPTLKFGVAEDASWELEFTPGSGVLGLSTSKTNSLSPLYQILDQVDRKVFSFWNSALDEFGNGTGLLTFGAEDLQNCPSAYVHANQIEGYSFNAQSLSVGELSVNLNNASFVEWGGISTTKQEVYDFFVKAAGVDADQYGGWSEIDCDKIDSLPTINLNLGNNEAVTLKPADYTAKSSDTQDCYIAVSLNSHRGVDVQFGFNFMENRCFSFNMDSKQIGFGNSN